MYACGCTDLPFGACDCDGNIIDECGVCGGGGIAQDACDCEGNTLDALGVCGGLCGVDQDGDGLCDDEDGCTDLNACNFMDAEAQNCQFCGCAPEAYTLDVEAHPAAYAGGVTYRMYVNMLDPTDRVSAVYGNSNDPFEIHVPEGAFNTDLNPSWNASGLHPAFVSIYPELVDDTYATIGLSGPANSSGLEGASDPTLVEDPAQPISGLFLEDGSSGFVSNLIVGSSWFSLNEDANALPDEAGRVLVMQVTTSGSIHGQINIQIFPKGIGEDEVRARIAFDGAGTWGVPEELNACGCTDEGACNFSASAEYEDGSCLYDDVCGAVSYTHLRAHETAS